MGSFAPLPPAQNDLRARDAGLTLLEPPDSGRELRHAQRAHWPNPESFLHCAPFSWAASCLAQASRGERSRVAPPTDGGRMPLAATRPPQASRPDATRSFSRAACSWSSRLFHGQPLSSDYISVRGVTRHWPPGRWSVLARGGRTQSLEPTRERASAGHHPNPSPPKMSPPKLTQAFLWRHGGCELAERGLACGTVAS